MRAIILAFSYLAVATKGQTDPRLALGELLFALNSPASLPRSQRASTASMGLSVGDEFPADALKQFGVKGKKSVLFFYGADDAPSCSKQIAAFSGAVDDFAADGFTVVGVRNGAGVKEDTDSAVTLVVDEDDAVREEIGIAKDLFGLLGGRETYVLDKDGTIVEVHNNQFDPASHVKVALAAVEAMPEEEPPKSPLEDFFCEF
jgi:peroxiredoxin Q/BCP